MTRRLDYIDPTTGWHPLLIVAAIGACIIALAVCTQVVQIVVSIRDRKKNPAGNDPWNGRTLEWSIPSPAPAYNFAVIPQVQARDAFWFEKQHGTTTPQTEVKDIEMPRNTPVGLFIAAASFFFGFGMIWHIWWLAVVGFVAIAAFVIARSFETHIEYRVTPSSV